MDSTDLTGSSSLLNMNNYLVVVSQYCINMLQVSVDTEMQSSSSSMDLEKHRNEVLLFGVIKSLSLQKVVSDFEDALKCLLSYLYEDLKNYQRLFYTLQSATSVSEEYIDGNVYFYIQSENGSSFVHISDPSKVQVLNAYFYLYHFKEYCQLNFVQLTKFGNEKDLEFSNCIWATMVISNWKVFCEHVNHCLNFLNKF